MTENSNWKTNVLMIGGLIGLLTGIAASFLFIKKREQSDGDLKISSGEGMKIGMGVVTLLKMISDSGSNK
jgi:LPXTG-motif cell wall-anchored protein